MSQSTINADKRMVAVAIILCTVLGGCSDIYYDRRESIALSAGDAVATDRVTQMVDPWPARSSNKNIAFNGEKMQTAVERYRNNKVIQPVNATTSIANQITPQAAPAVAPLKP